MDIIQKFLTPNQYSRPQRKLEKINKIVVHWVGNAGSTAEGNRNYFESLKSGQTYITKNGQKAYTYASSHYVIGLNGEIIQCIPESEWAYCSNSMNKESISIENCHPDWIGRFNISTYNSLIQLCADICKRYNLNPLTDIIRHYDVISAGGKDCPRWFVNNPADWEKFKKDVDLYIKEKELTWREILKKTSANPQDWEKAINTIVELAKDANIGELDIFQYLPNLIENIHNSK